ncbi:MAG TPA: hypothetical protein DCO72_06730 [Ruminococcus sp.]|nr:hypothetical protein [Ruminococcus sp.]
MNFTEYLTKIREKSLSFQEFSEESAKTEFVLPFFAELGYDTTDSKVFCQDYSYGRKIADFAILENETPLMVIFMEQSGKISRFNTQQVPENTVYMLTNGIRYQMFLDRKEKDPFFTFSLTENEPDEYEYLLPLLCYGTFQGKETAEDIMTMQYIRKVQKILFAELISPSDELLDFLEKKGGKIPDSMREHMRSVTASAIRDTLQQNNISEYYSTYQQVSAISAQIQTASLCWLPDCHCQEEDTHDVLRVHIYTSANKKIGIVKIKKSDFTMQFRDLSKGAPTIHILESPEEFTELIQKISSERGNEK